MPRPVPALNSENRAFWTGGADGRLHINRCGDCGGWIHPPRPVCRHCLSDNVSAQPVSGAATVDTYTINHQAWYPGLEVPFIIARVALDDAPGVILTTNVIDCPVDAIDIGDTVQVTFEQQGDIFYPLFRKTGSEPIGGAA